MTLRFALLWEITTTLVKVLLRGELALLRREGVLGAEGWADARVLAESD